MDSFSRSCVVSGIGSMSLSPSSNSSRKQRNYDSFPIGLRVLVVDHDPTCLKVLEKMLKTYGYTVTKCSRAEEALSMLRKDKDEFDVVICDIHVPDMDVFKLIECIDLETNLPVIMMVSADDDEDVVMKGVVGGACDCLVKPIRRQSLKNIWQHVFRKWKDERKDVEQCCCGF